MFKTLIVSCPEVYSLNSSLYMYICVQMVFMGHSLVI